MLAAPACEHTFGRRAFVRRQTNLGAWRRFGWHTCVEVNYALHACELMFYAHTSHRMRSALLCVQCSQLAVDVVAQSSSVTHFFAVGLMNSGRTAAAAGGKDANKPTNMRPNSVAGFAPHPFIAKPAVYKCSYRATMPRPASCARVEITIFTRLKAHIRSGHRKTRATRQRTHV